MIQVVRTSSFVRAYKRLLRGHPGLENLFKDKLQIFMGNPFDPSLRTHKLSGNLKECFAFSIDHHLRVVFRFAQSNIAMFENIGSHDDVY